MSLIAVRTGRSAATRAWATPPAAMPSSIAAIRTALVPWVCTAVEYYPRSIRASSRDKDPRSPQDPEITTINALFLLLTLPYGAAYAQSLGANLLNKGAELNTTRPTRSWWMPLLLSIYALNTAYLAASA